MFRKLFTINLLIKLLLGVIAVSLAFTLYSFFFGQRAAFKKEILNSSSRLTALPQQLIQQNRKDYSLFLSGLKARKVFSSPYAKKPKPVSGASREELNKIIESLRLAGIKSGDSARAIIEDKRMGKVFYLKEGGTFLDNIELEKIKKDSVILNCQGESYELYL